VGKSGFKIAWKCSTSITRCLGEQVRERFFTNDFGTLDYTLELKSSLKGPQNISCDLCLIV